VKLLQFKRLNRQTPRTERKFGLGDSVLYRGIVCEVVGYWKSEPRNAWRYLVCLPNGIVYSVPKDAIKAVK